MRIKYEAVVKCKKTKTEKRKKGIIDYHGQENDSDKIKRKLEKAYKYELGYNYELLSFDVSIKGDVK